MSSVDSHAQLLVLTLLLSAAAPETSANAPALRKLRELSSEELIQLVDAGYPKADVSLDFRGIDHGLRMIRERRARDARLEHFISHGATTAMLRQLFRLPVAKIEARRAELLGKHRQRRPQLPPPASAMPCMPRGGRCAAQTHGARQQWSNTAGCTSSFRTSRMQRCLR